MRMYRNRYLAVCGLFTLSVAPLFLTGCENADVNARKQATDDLKEAASQIEYVAFSEESSQTPNSANELETGYKKILSILSSNSRGGASSGQPLAEQQAAKDALSSEANMGLVRLQMKNIQKLEQGLTNSTYLLNRKIDNAIDLASMLNAAESFDYSGTLRNIDSQEDSSRAHKVQAERDLRTVQNEIADLESKIQAELGECTNLQEQSAVVSLQVNDAPLDDRQNLIHQAADISRQADKHQVAAAMLEVNLDMIKPRLAELQNHIAQAETELISFEHSRSSLLNREEVLAREIAQTKADLAAVIEQINAEFANIAANYQNVIEPMYTDALDTANDSVNLARNAMSMSTLGRLRVSQANHTLGQVYWNQVQSLQPFVQTLTRMVAINDILSRGNQDQTLLEEINNKITDLTEKASNAYGEAIGSAESEKGNNTETLFTLKYAKALIDGVDVASIDMPVIEKPVVADMGDEVAVNRPNSDPSAVLQNMQAMAKEMNYRGMLKLLYPDTALEREYLDAFDSFLAALDSLNSTTKDHLDRSLYEVMQDPEFTTRIASMLPAGVADSGAGGMDFKSIPGSLTGGDALDIDVDTLTFSYDNSGSTAWIDNNAELEKLLFVYVDNQWKIDFAVPVETVPDEVKDIVFRAMKSIETVLADIEQRVRDDEFGDEWSMIAVLMNQTIETLMPIIQEAMQNMGGGMDFPQPPGGGGGG